MNLTQHANNTTDLDGRESVIDQNEPKARKTREQYRSVFFLRRGARCLVSRPQFLGESQKVLDKWQKVTEIDYFCKIILKEFF